MSTPHSVMMKLAQLTPKGFKRLIPSRVKEWWYVRQNPPAPPPEEPVGDVYYGERAAGYLSERTQREWWDIEQDIMRRVLQSVPDAVVVLDVPFGTGRFIPFYKQKGMTIRGLEISQDMVDAAKADLGDQFDGVVVDIGDARSMPYDDNAFEVVSCFRFLQSIVSYGDALKVIEELVRVSSDYVIMELGVRDASAKRKQPLALDKRMAGWLYRPEIEKMLTERGLRVIHTEGPIGCLYDDATYHVFVCRKQTPARA